MDVNVNLLEWTAWVSTGVCLTSALLTISFLAIMGRSH